jgi:hypothetical protein
MGTQAHAQRRVFIEMPPESLDAASAKIGRESDAEIVHSENNILHWMAYFCIGRPGSCAPPVADDVS